MMEGKNSWLSPAENYVSSLFDEFERGRIHTISQARGLGTVVEDVPQVGVTQGAGNRVPDHAVSCVTDGPNVLRRDWLPETGPAGARIEFGHRTEQRSVTAYAAVETLIVQIPIFSTKSNF